MGIQNRTKLVTQLFKAGTKFRDSWAKSVGLKTEHVAAVAYLARDPNKYSKTHVIKALQKRTIPEAKFKRIAETGVELQSAFSKKNRDTTRTVLAIHRHLQAQGIPSGIREMKVAQQFWKTAEKGKLDNNLIAKDWLEARYRRMHPGVSSGPLRTFEQHNIGELRGNDKVPVGVLVNTKYGKPAKARQHAWMGGTWISSGGQRYIEEGLREKTYPQVLKRHYHGIIIDRNISKIIPDETQTSFGKHAEDQFHKSMYKWLDLDPKIKKRITHNSLGKVFMVTEDHYTHKGPIKNVGRVLYGSLVKKHIGK